LFPENFLIAERIGCRDPSSSKKRALQELAKLLSLSAPELNEDAVFDKLLERERLGSTGLGYGIALPHARVTGIEEARGAFLQLEAPIPFDSVDNHPVDLIFGLLVPESATEEHLQLLAKLAKLFHDPQFCARLRAAQNPGEVLDRILHHTTEEPDACSG
jgi:PTS system nitrogen regulatory IIA component